MKKSIVIILCILLVIGIAVIVFFYISHQRQQEQDLRGIENEKIDLITGNIFQYVTVDKTYETKTFGTENLIIYLKNTSGYKIDKVVVNVKFSGSMNNRLYCDDNVVFENVFSGDNWNQMKGPHCSDGKDISIKIVRIESAELMFFQDF